MAGCGMPKTIKGLEFQDFVRLRVGGNDFLDGKYLHGAATAHIRDDLVLGMGLIQSNRLGGVREKIDRRRATQPECFFRNVEFQGLLAFASFETRDEKYDFHARAKAGGSEVFETLQVDEKELFGKMKILLKKPVAGE